MKLLKGCNEAFIKVISSGVSVVISSLSICFLFLSYFYFAFCPPAKLLTIDSKGTFQWDCILLPVHYLHIKLLLSSLNLIWLVFLQYRTPQYGTIISTVLYFTSSTSKYKVTQWKPINTLIASNKSLNNYVAVKLFHTLNTKN